MLEDNPELPPRPAGVVTCLKRVLAVAVLTAAAYSSSALGDTSRSAAKVGSLAPLIAEEFAALNVKPHTATLTTDKAMAAAESLRRGDCQSAATMVKEILGQSKLQAFSFQPFDRFAEHLSLGNEPQFLDGLNLWVSKLPSAAAYLIRAKYFYDTAWLIRGEDFSSAVPAEHMTQFHKNLDLAQDDVRQSIRLDPNIPWSYFLRLQISEVHDEKRDIERAFASGIARYPNYYVLYRVRLHYLQPKWGGSPAAMAQFVAQYAGSVPPSSPRNLLYMQLAANVLNEAWVECRENQLLTACMDAYMNRNVGSGLTDGVTKALNVYKFSDPVQFSNALWPILSEILNTPGGTQSINTLLQLAADAMGSNTELIQDSKHSNNYVIDDITARVWANLRNTDNVDQKFREALDDVEHMTFSSEDDEAVALGKIYDDMALVATNASQYIKVIAYQDAANAVAGENRDGTMYKKCYAYHALRHFQEAVDECTHVIDMHRGTLRAHVYRAWANESLKNYDAALAEYGDIADHGSDNALRTGAVIDMEHINALQGKTAGELAIFEKYPFVFDADIQSDENLAIVYNNRCYAYMKSGQPRKALDDCNTSLKYGRLPDALHKQQELLKLLSQNST